ncbi:MAG TPA: AraC family transcriptional regulator [Chthoniobacterales bacterium]|jgi:AraC family transcriptional regulator|nr:AraC family transcriptional regulator [Chthoniobacterales bacterium]
MATRKFHGTTLKAREAAGFALKEIRHPAGVFIPKHSHANAHVGFILDGGFTETFTGKTLECRPLSVSYIAPGLAHTDDFRSAVRCLVFEVAPERLANLRPLLHLDQPICVHGGPAAWLTLRMYREALRTDTASVATIEGLALEILAELTTNQRTAPKKMPPWLEQARDLLHSRFPVNLTHDQIARTVGVHPVHLAMSFRRYFKTTIGEYVRGLRIDHAAARMARGDESLAEVALAAGFSDQSHFSKVFRQQTGMTPGGFRASLPDRRKPRYLRPIQDIRRGR